MKLKLIQSFFTAILAVFATHSFATTITFEELGPKSCCFAGEPTLDTQYSSQGVTFDGGWEVLNQSGNFGVDALSGEHFAAYNTTVTGVSDTIGIAFDNNVRTVSGYLGTEVDAIWNIEAFLNGQSVFATSVNSSANNYANFILSSLTMDYITITGSYTFGVLEDLSYSAVPIPAAIWLFGTGLVGLAAFARRQRA